MKRLTLIRHTTTVTVPGRCHGGGSELPLAPTFPTEAAALHQEIPSPITHFHTSHLKRCRLLAGKLSPDADWKVDARLAEIHFGDWEGKLWDNLTGPELDAWMQDYVTTAPPNGESTLQAAERTSDFLNSLGDGEHLAITHCGIIRIILATALGMPLANLFQIKVSYGCVAVLSCKENRWTLERLVSPA
jgi:alpha-ribazole phosphatase